MIRVLLVDDDALVRSGLRMMLAGAANLDVVAEAADGREVLGAVDLHRPDVVLMDIRMPQLALHQPRHEPIDQRRRIAARRAPLNRSRRALRHRPSTVDPAPTKHETRREHDRRLARQGAGAGHAAIPADHRRQPPPPDRTPHRPRRRARLQRRDP
jgi:CheY-like chemotaxis protein